jgi:hypothetical protein
VKWGRGEAHGGDGGLGGWPERAVHDKLQTNDTVAVVVGHMVALSDGFTLWTAAQHEGEALVLVAAAGCGGTG